MKTIFDFGKIEVNTIDESLIEIQLWDGYSFDPINETMGINETKELLKALQDFVSQVEAKNENQKS